MTTARVIIANNCNRDCLYCHLNCKSLMDKAITIQTMFAIKNYDVINLIGGELMREPSRTLKIVEVIKALNPKAKIYAHSAKYSVELIVLMDKIDGITFYLQSDCVIPDVVGFNKFQVVASRFPDKSFRLRVHPKIRARIPISPYVWSEIKTLPKTNAEEYKVPAGESLFLLKVI